MEWRQLSEYATGWTREEGDSTPDADGRYIF
jgi:hypothetical protein